MNQFLAVNVRKTACLPIKVYGVLKIKSDTASVKYAKSLKVVLLKAVTTVNISRGNHIE